MAETVNLQSWAPLPDDTNFVLVKSRSDGNFDVVIWTGEPSKTTIAYDTNVAPLSFAIQRAKAEADRLGISVVYVEKDHA